MVARQPKMEALHTIASELLQVPASPTEKQQLENRIASLYTDWDELCQQCVPAGVLPLVSTPTGIGGSLTFQPPSEFEDVSQMLEWLILIESKLQPVVITVGDFVHLKKLLRDLQGIEKELKLREKDYKKFMAGFDTDDVCSLLDSDQERPLSTSNAAVVAATAVSVNFSKSVKFNDENTLERALRQKEIQKQIHVNKFGAGSTESSSEFSDLDPLSPTGLHFIPYHSAGPAVNAQQGHDHNDSNKPVLELNSPAISQSRILKRLSSDPEGSLSRILRSLESSPMSPISEEHYHLALLWKSIWLTLLQERERLDGVQERWKCFESKKEEFSKFLFKAEERMPLFLRVIGNTKNFGVIQTEMTAQKVCCL